MLALNPEQMCLFQCIQSALGQGDLPIAPDADWNKVLDEAIAQTVVLLVSPVVFRQRLDDSARQRWEKAENIYTISNLRSMYATCETDRIMRENHFSYYILKGLASASYYPEPARRALGDTDFLIDSNFREAVEESFVKEGYQKEDHGSCWHTVLSKTDQHLEMHYELPGRISGKVQELVKQYMEGALSTAEAYELQGSRIMLPLPQYHGLILLLHMQNHMLSSGIGLRHLTDWGCFVKTTCDDKFWQDQLLPILNEIGMYYYAQVITRMCALYFKTPCPAWAESVPEDLCDALMDDFLAGGNFGRKDMERSNSSSFMAREMGGGVNKGNFTSLWHNLQLATEQRYPIVKKVPVLYLVFDFVMVVRRVILLMAGKRQSLINSAGFAKKRKQLYRRLKLFIVEGEPV